MRLIKKLAKAANLDESGFAPKDLQYFINKHKDEGRRPQHLKAGADRTSTQMIKFYGDYEQACARSGVIDFAELLLRAYELWRDNPALLEHYRHRFRHVLVDEFQDTNSIQYAWIRLLVGSTGALFVVGDDDQCVAAGTLVTMADGSKRPIETIQVGEQVLSSYGSGDLRASHGDGAVCSSASWPSRAPAPAFRAQHHVHPRAHPLRRLCARRDAADLLPVPHA